MLVLYPELEQKELIDQSNTTLLPLIRKIRQVFEDHFDRTWFAIIIDGLPIDFRTIRMIRELVGLQSIHVGDEWFIYQAVVELSRFSLLIRKFLLPVLKERLGVSGLIPHRIVRDRTQYILRRFVAYTFPFNLERLEALTAELRTQLLDTFPTLEPPA
ncbi:MAG: hypothetical protein JSV89_11555 [Spirochaetaceae bacterium]|nr:MAG: hypothetical protein JSV89_11555 [Spirochaetaceae bacterium]